MVPVEVRKLELHQGGFSRKDGKPGDPPDYNRVIISQKAFSGSTYPIQSTIFVRNTIFLDITKNSEMDEILF